MSTWFWYRFFRSRIKQLIAIAIQKYTWTIRMLLFYHSYVPVRPSKPVISLGGPAIEGKPLTLSCVSTGGYPRQDVNWYRGSVSPDNRLSGTISFVNNTLYNVTNTYMFTPTSADDRVLYICQSSYGDEPRLIETSNQNLLLACK